MQHLCHLDATAQGMKQESEEHSENSEIRIKAAINWEIEKEIDEIPRKRGRWKYHRTLEGKIVSYYSYSCIILL